MLEEPGPPHGDEWLVTALRERRPGAAGYIYNVHGPALIGYANLLLGDHDLAVETVRATLVACRDEPDASRTPAGSATGCTAASGTTVSSASTPTPPPQRAGRRKRPWRGCWVSGGARWPPRASGRRRPWR
jgi:hypothetical protein